MMVILFSKMGWEKMEENRVLHTHTWPCWHRMMVAYQAAAAEG